MLYAYPCQFTPVDDGSLIATFPDVPEAISGGADRSDALAMAEDALATALAGYVHEKWEIPAPSQANDDQTYGPRVARSWPPSSPLYSAMRAQRITKVELARRLGISESAARKLTNPDHRSHVSQVHNSASSRWAQPKGLKSPPPEGEEPPASRLTLYSDVREARSEP